MQREHHGWNSHHLGRPMEFLWFGWSGRPLITFPTSGGRFNENEDFHLIDSLADKIERGEIQVICPDVVDNDSWYNYSAPPEWRALRHQQYDQYLRHELVPFIQHKAQRSDLMVYGASFGGYHAANFAAKHPDVVSRAICFSGLYDIHRFVAGYWDDNCYFNCPTAYIANMSEWDASVLRRTEWVIATGEHDSLVQENRDFSSLLWSKGIPNHLEIWEGQFGHDWPWWREHLRRFV